MSGDETWPVDDRECCRWSSRLQVLGAWRYPSWKTHFTGRPDLVRGWTGVQWLSARFLAPSLSHVPDKHLSQSHQLQVVMIDSLVLLTDKCAVPYRNSIPTEPPTALCPSSYYQDKTPTTPPTPAASNHRACLHYTAKQSKAMGRACVRASPSSNAHARLVLTSKISFFHPPCSYSNSLCSASLPSISHSRTKLPGA